MLQLTQPMRALFAYLALAVLTCLSEALFAMNAEDHEEPAGSRLFEVLVRQTTTSLEGDIEYSLIGISTGVGI